MTVAILRTTITPEGNSDLVELEISDGPLSIESASMEGSIRLTVETHRLGYRTPPLAYVQLDAVTAALDALRGIAEGLRKEIDNRGYQIPAHRT